MGTITPTGIIPMRTITRMHTIMITENTTTTTTIITMVTARPARTPPA